MVHDTAAQAWCEITWREIGERADRFRAAIVAVGLEAGDRVALLLPNGIDWVCFDMAALSLGLVVVPLYSYDSPANHAFILKHSGARLALVDTTERWEAIVALHEPVPNLEQIWVRDASSSELPAPLRRLAGVLPATAALPARISVGPDDLATLIYTSGTTGRPKGVMLTHAAILWNAEGVTDFITPLEDDVFLSFMPLAHAFERTVGYYLPMMAGATVAYARSVDMLRADLATVRPTVFVSVPRLYERTYAATRDQAARNVLKRLLLDLTARLGWRRFEWEQGRASKPGLLSRLIGAVLNQLVARRVLMAFGGRLRVAVSGGAGLPREIFRFMIGMGLPLVEGYGLTEAAPVVTATTLEDNLPGSAGRPLKGCEIRLSEQSELLVRSPSIMRGYWNDPEATAAAFDADGFLNTGDIADIRDGRLFIRGRLKEIIVLSTGENINPDPIETAVQHDPLVEQVCILGDGKPFPVAFLVLKKDRWKRLAGRLKVDPNEPNAATIKAEILKRIARNLKDFSKPSQIRGVHLVLESWTVREGLLTPTLKVKRYAIEAKYPEEFAALYAGHAVFD
jgi:long-chain acyl-CoA synthetase